MCKLTYGFLLHGSSRTLILYMFKDQCNEESPFFTVQSFLPSVWHNYMDGLQLHNLGMAVKGALGDNGR